MALALNTASQAPIPTGQPKHGAAQAQPEGHLVAGDGLEALELKIQPARLAQRVVQHLRIRATVGGATNKSRMLF